MQFCHSSALKTLQILSPLPGHFLFNPYPNPHCHCCTWWWNSAHHVSLSSDTTSVRKPSLISPDWAGLDACHHILLIRWLQLLALYYKTVYYVSVSPVRLLALCQVCLFSSRLYLQFLALYLACLWNEQTNTSMKRWVWVEQCKLGNIWKT